MKYEILSFLSHPVTISVMSAGGAASLNYLINKGKIKADTENIVTNTYQRLLKDLTDQMDRLARKVEDLELRLTSSNALLGKKQILLEQSILEKNNLLQELKTIRKRNEELMKDNKLIMERNEALLISNSVLTRESNSLQAKMIALEERIAKLDESQK